MISNRDKRKYLRLLTTLKGKHAKIFTQKEIAGYLSISERKVNSFLRGKIYDFWMLTQYAGLIGIDITFNIEKS